MPIETKSSASAPFSDQLLTDLRTDELHAPQLDRRVFLRNSADHRSDNFGARYALLHRQPDQHVAARCRSSAPLASAKPRLRHGLADLVDVRPPAR